MKKQKSKKKLNKRQTTQHDATAKYMAESTKEVEALGGLDLAPLAPLAADVHRD